MNWSRIGIVVLGSGWFFLVSCAAGLFIGTRVVSQLDARDVRDGDSLHNDFTIVIGSNDRSEPFYFLPWDALAPSEYSGSYLMPLPSGSLDSETSHFTYEVIEKTASGQVIEVVETYHDGDNTIWSRYEATGSSITPISSRMFYFGYMFAAFPYAIGSAFLLYFIGRFLRHRHRNPDV